MNVYTNILALGSDYILGIIIACIIIVALVAYFIVDRIRDKKFIADVEAKREEMKKIESEKEMLHAEYRKAKKVGSDFLDQEDKDAAAANKNEAPDISKLIKKPASVEDASVITDEMLDDLVLVVKDNKVYNQKIKEVTITTTQINQFEDGEIVNPVSLAIKGIVPNYSHYYLKVIAKAPIKKVVEVEAHEYDDSAKMIILAGGKVTKVI